MFIQNYKHIKLSFKKKANFVQYDVCYLCSKCFWKIAFLGQTIPPLQLNNYVLGLDEVNSQHAIFNVTSQVKELFKDYLVDCENAALLPSGSVFAFAASALLVLTNLFL